MGRNVRQSVNILGFFYLLSYYWADCFETLQDDTRHRSALSLSPFFLRIPVTWPKKWGQNPLWDLFPLALLSRILPNFVWWYQTLVRTILQVPIPRCPYIWSEMTSDGPWHFAVVIYLTLSFYSLTCIATVVGRELAWRRRLWVRVPLEYALFFFKIHWWISITFFSWYIVNYK